MIILTVALKCILSEMTKATLFNITPKTPRSRCQKCMKLLGKVDPFPFFLLELAHSYRR
jgi:hypothetical protein